MVGIGKKSYGFMNFYTLNNKFYNRFYPKNTWNAFYCCNDAVPWLNKAKNQIFRCNFQIHLYFIYHLSATCCKTRFHYVHGYNFSHNECNWHLQYEYVVPKKIYPLHHDDSFHPLLAFIVLL